MFIKPAPQVMDCTRTASVQRARVSLAMAGLLFSVSAQAFLPTPSVLLTPSALVTPIETEKLAVASQTAALQMSTTTAAYQSTQEPALRVQSTQSEQLSDTAQLLSMWRKQVQADNLAQHTTWRRLLYFYDDQNSIIAKKTADSLVDDPSFFLSAEGQRDSGAELDATLVALAQALVSPSANHQKAANHQKTAAQTNNDALVCRFPARVQWLSERLNIDQAALLTDCPALDSWMQMLAPKQLSIMFAEEYLDNPISAFAHTLLRIDSKASAADPNQIQHAVALNYTVGGDPNDSFVVYASKSMIGRYDNAIEIDPYPEKLAKYLQDDERDAWTYQLDLTPAEVEQIMRHVWETKDLKLPYYFTTDNCASEILRLIDVVRPKQRLLSQLPYAIVPSDVIQLLDDKGLLASSAYTPADNTLRQAQLNEAKQLGYRNSDKSSLDTIKSAKLNPISSLSADGQRLRQRRINVSDNNPTDRHRLQLGHIGIGQRADNNYIDMGVRAGFHDSLDRPTGFSQFFNLEGLAATLRFYDDNDHNKGDKGNNNNNNQPPKSVVLQNLTLLRGRSFNPVNTAKQGKTWGASIEATRVRDGSRHEDTDHLVASMGYETGWSWAFGTPSAGSGEMPPQLCYTFLTGTAQAGRSLHKGLRVGAGVNAGCRYQINNQLRAQAQLQLPYWYHGNGDAPHIRGHYWQPISSLGLQYDIDKNQALRIDANYDWQERVDADDLQLSYRRYF